jgi:hypothetical protein
MFLQLVYLPFFIHILTTTESICLQSCDTGIHLFKKKENLYVIRMQDYLGGLNLFISPTAFNQAYITFTGVQFATRTFAKTSLSLLSST